ncbi:putative structural maintenance of chromosomes protein [Helianthus annuus]|nr:putative structural maintenance of chromosomes protein [Helianthus annuus]
MQYNKNERKIKKQRETYKAFRDKLSAIHTALDKRWSKFQRNATLLKRQLTWQFNGHLGKKGISGHIKVKMPQDASTSNVRDTRGLSGFLYLINIFILVFFLFTISQTGDL